MTLEEASNAVRLYVEAKPYEDSRMNKTNWLERLDDCLTDIRLELAKAAQDDGVWAKYVDMTVSPPASKLDENSPRYSARRMRMEIDRVKNFERRTVLEEAIVIVAENDVATAIRQLRALMAGTLPVPNVEPDDSANVVDKSVAWDAAQASFEKGYEKGRAEASPTEETAGIIARFEQAYPELYWHIAKGKICAGEPLYGAIIATMGTTEIGHGESDVSAEEAFRIAVDNAGLFLQSEVSK